MFFIMTKFDVQRSSFLSEMKILNRLFEIVDFLAASLAFHGRTATSDLRCRPARVGREARIALKNTELETAATLRLLQKERLPRVTSS
jgi:hypothetical protein